MSSENFIFICRFLCHMSYSARFFYDILRSASSFCYLKNFGSNLTTKKILHVFRIFFFIRRNLAIKMLHYKTLYSHVSYIKFCHKALLSNVVFTIFFLSRRQKKNYMFFGYFFLSAKTYQKN